MKRLLPSLLLLAVAGGANAALVTITITGTDAYGPLAITSAAGGGSVVDTIPANAPL